MLKKETPPRSDDGTVAVEREKGLEKAWKVRFSLLKMTATKKRMRREEETVEELLASQVLLVG